jgi:hypothetical protein
MAGLLACKIMQSLLWLEQFLSAVTREGFVALTSAI